MIYKQLKLSNQFCFRFYTISRLITQHYQPFLNKLGITYPQYLVLMVLWENDDQLVTDIADKLYLKSNTVTPLLQRMEKQKILVRKVDKSDRRKVVVSLTAHGRNMMEQAKDIPLAMSELLSDDIMKRLVDNSAEIKELFDKMIKEMSNNLKE